MFGILHFFFGKKMFPYNRYPCYYDEHRNAHCIPKNEHIVFMGDSLTRYQYLALCYSLHKKSEMSTSEFPSLVKEREWKHWIPFLNGTTEKLKPNAKCDCHRSYARPVGSKTIENRYFWIEREKSPILNISFIQVLNPMKVLGQWKPGDDDSIRNRVNLHFSPLWNLSWEMVIKKIVGKLHPKPTVLILNSGLWNGEPNETFAKTLRDFGTHVAPRVIWKTTTKIRTAGNSKWLKTDLKARRVFNEIFDAAFLTRNLKESDYWDLRHFQPHVYNKLNAALLKQLYGETIKCISFRNGNCVKSI